jgi:hypothetical protein
MQCKINNVLADWATLTGVRKKPIVVLGQCQRDAGQSDVIHDFDSAIAADNHFTGRAIFTMDLFSQADYDEWIRN